MKAFYTSTLYRKYYALLTRYSKRIISDEDAAATIAAEVLWEYYNTHGDTITTGSREYLKDATRYSCIGHQQINIFNRKLISPFLKPRPHNILNQPFKTLFL